jgi:hypothetical protein
MIESVDQAALQPGRDRDTLLGLFAARMTGRIGSVRDGQALRCMWKRSDGGQQREPCYEQDQAPLVAEHPAGPGRRSRHAHDPQGLHAVPAFAPGETRRLGLFLAAIGLALLGPPLAGCARHDASASAERADVTYHTGIFTWLAAHDPSAVVLWHVPIEVVREIAPDARLSIAGSEPCREARHAQALLLLVASASDATERGRAEDCGFAVVRDGGGLVVAPL